MKVKLALSILPKVWIFDLDGTLVKHNGYLMEGDTLLPGVKELFEKIPETDFIIILTSRSEEYREITESFLKEHGIRYNAILFGLPQGERILINDIKPSGLLTAYAINKERDSELELEVIRITEL
ncbi:hypothetical protein Ferpe_1862 [Fervidobacterium pennivorans DSM 9078]|uniref:FCP1 homology domain-containing protein n=1 Tax=Fervidobacterium pennivorans (strain DSM 9078 / Ven5) TaxID=771875 RepID=H9UEG9_FERPD|nr:hypothetical protein [Fervidobacterium pennivorans]AFG35912.1 hypothetical protein Ferpe_1862 [Fervidobacterium pennivorans DSM 9078]